MYCTVKSTNTNKTSYILLFVSYKDVAWEMTLHIQLEEFLGINNRSINQFQAVRPIKHKENYTYKTDRYKQTKNRNRDRHRTVTDDSKGHVKTTH